MSDPVDTPESAIVVTATPVGAKAEQFHTERPEDPAVGKWYWVTSEEESWLGCIVHLGSNYAKLEGVQEDQGTNVIRIHLDSFFEHCKYEPNAEAIISGEVTRRQKKVNALMGKVVDITRRLAVSPDTQALPSGSETRALATIGGAGQPIESYKTALVHAKEEELPDLFKQIKRENENLSHWMSAQLIPLQAQAEGLKPAIKAIEHRLFSVELYAGLAEQVELIKDGAPAALTEKINLFQRRCYMDEEYLAQYEAGGMEFKDIPDFDKWLTRPSNLERLLPFPRTIVAFRVRRYDKEREVLTFRDFFNAINSKKADKFTYLYIRNGERVYRMSTSIEFDEDLFPDEGKHILNTGGPIWARGKDFRYEWDERRGLISDNEYQGMKETYAQKLAEYEALSAKDKKKTSKPHPYHEEYQVFNRDNLYYDDIAKYLAKQADIHNRLVLVLQGLLDRSPVLHPHPTWSLWDGGSFREALNLIYDNARALTTGDKPDFEAYRRELNKLLTVGCITVGQDREWAREEAAKEDRNRMYRGSRDGYNGEFYRPQGNPGPGILAYVTKVNRKAGTVTYQWNKRRSQYLYDDDAESDPKKLVACSFTTKMENVLNVTAYKPGDFKKFWSDPRTRADYIQWGYELLPAEDFHAGKRKVAKVRLAPPKPRSLTGSHDYQIRKRNKALVDQAVRLRSGISTTDGAKYAKDSLWRVTCYTRGTFTIQLLKDDGSGAFADSYKVKEGKFEFDRYHRVGKMGFYDFYIDSAVPPRPVIKREKPPEQPKPEPPPAEDDDADSEPPESDDDIEEGFGEDDDASGTDDSPAKIGEDLEPDPDDDVDLDDE